MISAKVTMELTRKLIANGVMDTTSWISSHTESEALMYLYGEDPIIIKHPGLYSTYSDNMRPAPEIVDWCEKHDVKISEFNFPCVIDESLTDCSAVFAYCNSFNWAVLIPENCEHVDYMFYKCLAYNKVTEFPKSVQTYKGALYMCDALTSQVIIHSNIQTPGELFRHAYRTFISDSRTEEEAIYQC